MEDQDRPIIISFKVFGATDVGMVRDHNEDDFRICLDLATNTWKVNSEDVVNLGEKGCAFILSDGMGGANSGEVASRLAVEYSKDYLCQIENIPNTPDSIYSWLLKCCEYVQIGLLKEIEKKPNLDGMGATLVIGYLCSSGLFIAWIGDSRVYQYAPNGFVDYKSEYYKHRTSNLKLITDDHSLVWEKVMNSNGRYSPEDARLDPNSNVITKYIGGVDYITKADIIGPILLESSHRIVLCSDGLNGMISDIVLDELLENNLDTEQAVYKMIESAKLAGGHDNITVILLDIVTGHPVYKLKSFPETSVTHLVHDADEKDTHRIQRPKSKSNLYVIILSVIVLLTCVYLFINNRNYFNPSNQSNTLPSDNTPTDSLLGDNSTFDSINELKHKIKEATPKISPEIKPHSNDIKTEEAPKLNFITPTDSTSKPLRNTENEIKSDTIHQTVSPAQNKKNITPTQVNKEVIIEEGVCKSSKKCVNGLQITRYEKNGNWYYVSSNPENKFIRQACNAASIEDRIDNMPGNFVISFCLVKNWNKYDKESIPIVVHRIKKMN